MNKKIITIFLASFVFAGTVVASNTSKSLQAREYTSWGQEDWDQQQISAQFSGLIQEAPPSPKTPVTVRQAPKPVRKLNRKVYKDLSALLLKSPGARPRPQCDFVSPEPQTPKKTKTPKKDETLQKISNFIIASLDTEEKEVDVSPQTPELPTPCKSPVLKFEDYLIPKKGGWTIRPDTPKRMEETIKQAIEASRLRPSEPGRGSENILPISPEGPRWSEESRMVAPFGQMSSYGENYE